MTLPIRLFLLTMILCWIIYSRKDKPPIMWDHICPVEDDWISVAENECCNWCGKTKGDR